MGSPHGFCLAKQAYHVWGPLPLYSLTQLAESKALTKVKKSPLKGTQSERTTDNERQRNHPIGSNAAIEGQEINPSRGRGDA
jgi:hypothetical protein